MIVMLLCIVFGVNAETFIRDLNISKWYSPVWKDLDTRPLPQWYDSAKIGILVHWGVYSVPSFKGEWFWYYLQKGDPSVMEFLRNNSYTHTTYEDFVGMFTAHLFDSDKWAEFFSESGAKYVVFTAKHHDGFALFPSQNSHWNSMEVGPKKDIVKMISDSIRKYNIKFGVYYALSEWFNRMYNDDRERNFVTTMYTNKVVWPDIQFLINNYKPSILWTDGDGAVNDTYWKSPELLAWLYNKSPVKNEIVVNDRWGKGTSCHHGDFYNCKDRFNPRHLMPHKWENILTLDRYSRGFRRNMLPADVLSFNKLLETVVATVSCGGNILINIGAKEDSGIAPIFQDRLMKLGEWLENNGEAIYGTSPWFHQRDSLNTDAWYTCKKKEYNSTNPTAVPKRNLINAIYVIFLKWPGDNKLRIRDLARYVSNESRFEILKGEGGYDSLKHNISSKGSVVIHLVTLPLENSVYAWVVKITEKYHRRNRYGNRSRRGRRNIRDRRDKRDMLEGHGRCDRHARRYRPSWTPI